MKYHKTKCGTCAGGIEFPAYGVGEWIQCPHCGEATMLKVRRWKRFATSTALAGLAVWVGLAALAEYRSSLQAEARKEAREELEQKDAQWRALALDLANIGARYPMVQRPSATFTESMEQRWARERQDRQHREIVAEMREANWLATQANWERDEANRINRQAAFEADWNARNALWERERTPLLQCQPIDIMSTIDHANQQQTLDNMLFELRQLKLEQGIQQPFGR
jgi:DNA-directed RNA polymerase subunit RPC12/RpoP